MNLDMAHNYLKLKFLTNLIISLTRVINKDKTWLKKNKQTHKQNEINQEN